MRRAAVRWNTGDAPASTGELLPRQDHGLSTSAELEADTGVAYARTAPGSNAMDIRDEGFSGAEAQRGRGGWASTMGEASPFDGGGASREQLSAVADAVAAARLDASQRVRRAGAVLAVSSGLEPLSVVPPDADGPGTRASASLRPVFGQAPVPTAPGAPPVSAPAAWGQSPPTAITFAQVTEARRKADAALRNSSQQSQSRSSSVATMQRAHSSAQWSTVSDTPGNVMSVVSEPDRAAALGAALVDIVRARNDRERLPNGLPANGMPGHQSYGMDQSSNRAPSAPRQRPGGNDALDAALADQGKFRPTSEALAAREAEWQAMQKGSATTAQMRRSLRGPAAPHGASAHGDGEGAVTITPVGPVHRAAPAHTVESAGVSLVRALSSSKISSRGPSKSPERVRGSPAMDNSTERPALDSNGDADAAAAHHQEGLHGSVDPASADEGGSHQPDVPCGGIPEAGSARLLACTADACLHVLDARDGSVQRVIDIALPPTEGAAGANNNSALAEANPGLTFCIATLAALGLVVTATDCMDPENGTPATLMRAWPVSPQAQPQPGEGHPHLVLTIPRNTGCVLAMATLDERRLVVACTAGCLLVWNTLPAWPSHGGMPSGGQQLAHDVLCTEAHIVQPLHALAALPGAEVAAGGEDGVVRLWGTWDGGMEAELRGHSSCVTALEVLEGGAVLVSGDASAVLCVWDLMSGECMRVLRPGISLAGGGHGQQTSITCLWRTPRGHVLSAARDGTLVRWRAQDGEVVATTKPRASPGGGVAALMTLDAGHVVALCLDGRLRALEGNNGTPIVQLGALQQVTAVAVLGSGPSAPLGGPDARLRCGPVRVRDRLWCFAGGERLC